MNSLFVRVVLVKFANHPENSDPVVTNEWLEVSYDGTQTIEDLVKHIKNIFKISGDIFLVSSDGYRMDNSISLRILNYLENNNETIIVVPGVRQHTQNANMGMPTEGQSSPPPVNDITIEMRNEAENINGGNEMPETGGKEVLMEKEINTVVAAFSEQRFSDMMEDIGDKRTSPGLCTDYINDIMAYMFNLEKKYQIKSRFLDESLINSKMRAALMDWLVDVHNEYHFTTDTLYLCNKLLDRYLVADPTVLKSDLHLVGVTSLCLAAKYEEVFIPTLQDLADTCNNDNTFTAADIRLMEFKMLWALNFNLASPKPCFFLRLFRKVAKTDMKVYTLAKYIMELSVVDYKVVDMLPSAVAVGSLALAMMILETKPLHSVWNATLQDCSTFSIQNVRPHTLKMANVLARFHGESVKLKAIKEKYSKGKALFRISRIEELKLDKWKERILDELNND